MTSLVLHDYELDDGCYKVRLLLSMIGLAHKAIAVDVHPGREHLSPRYRRLSPQGALPILEDGALVLYGAEAILAYLAHRYDPARTWLPEEHAAFGRVLQWLAFAAGALQPAARARWHHMLEVEADAAAVDRAARAAFRVMDDHMTVRELDDASWFTGGAPTIADLALFPAIALSRDFGIEHEEYPALRRWIRRVRALPGFVTMPGIPSYA